MPLVRHLYRPAVWLAFKVSPLFSGGASKVARGIRGRRESADRLCRWGFEERDPDRPVVWFHAPSVGEGLQARAVIESLSEVRPDIQIVYTHFSPSAEGLASSMPAEISDYLPWDVDSEVGRVLDAVRPDLLVFTKTEVWPGLIKAADDRGVPAVLIAGALPENAKRLGGAGRWLLGPSFERLATVAAISEDDAARFSRLSVPPDRVTVTGDPGIDSSWRRVSATDPSQPYLAPILAEPRPTVIAGSTWSADEEVLIPALTALRADFPDLRAIIVPHEPEQERVSELCRGLGSKGWLVRTLSEVTESGELGGADGLVVDRVGVLAELYTVAQVAYVGGGFHDSGLHSVLEPAAAGLPIIFGPQHANSFAATELIRVGAATEVSSSGALRKALQSLLADEKARAEVGKTGIHYILEHSGAASRTASLVIASIGTQRIGLGPI